MNEIYHLVLIRNPRTEADEPYMVTTPSLAHPEFSDCKDCGPGTYARYSHTFVADGRVFRREMGGLRLAEVGPLPTRDATWRNMKNGREAAVVSVLVSEHRMCVDYRYRTPNPKSEATRMTRTRRNTTYSGLADFVEKFAPIGGA